MPYGLWLRVASHIIYLMVMTCMQVNCFPMQWFADGSLSPPPHPSHWCQVILCACLFSAVWGDKAAFLPLPGRLTSKSTWALTKQQEKVPCQQAWYLAVSTLRLLDAACKKKTSSEVLAKCLRGL